MIDLKTALRLTPAPQVAFVGSGGKTTALFTIARQFSGPVLVTSTTHLAINQMSLADHVVEIDSPEQLQLLGDKPLQGIHLITGSPGTDGRVAGLGLDSLEKVRALAERWQVPLLIEADGSRMRPLKAPGDHEPAIPDFADQVVIVAGMSGLDQPLSDTWVHRPERFASLSGLSLGDQVSLDALASVLIHPQGGLKNIPQGIRRCILLTQADRPDLLSKANSLAHRILPQVDSVVITSSSSTDSPGTGAALRGEFDYGAGFQVENIVEQIAGIILAAGASLRMGEPKQLLEWRGQPFVRIVARAALSAGLSPVIVVTGSEAAAVGSAVEDLDVRVIFNPEWETGQATSLRTGLRAVHEEIGAVVFLLADQPQIPANLITALIERHAVTLAPVIVPLVAGQRANPVMFDRVTFVDLDGLSGDTGGRALFASYPIEWLDWHDVSIHLDVDTPDDYQKLLNIP